MGVGYVGTGLTPLGRIRSRGAGEGYEPWDRGEHEWFVDFRQTTRAIPLLYRFLTLLVVAALGGCSTLRPHGEAVRFDADLHRDALINVEPLEGGISPIVSEDPVYGFTETGDDCVMQSRELLVQADSLIYDPVTRRFSVWGHVLDAETHDPVSNAELSTWHLSQTAATFGSVSPDGSFSITHRFKRREVLTVQARMDPVTPYRQLYFDLRRLL